MIFGRKPGVITFVRAVQILGDMSVFSEVLLHVEHFQLMQQNYFFLFFPQIYSAELEEPSEGWGMGHAVVGEEGEVLLHGQKVLC